MSSPTRHALHLHFLAVSPITFSQLPSSIRYLSLSFYNFCLFFFLSILPSLFPSISCFFLSHSLGFRSLPRTQFLRFFKKQEIMQFLMRNKIDFKIFLKLLNNTVPRARLLYCRCHLRQRCPPVLSATGTRPTQG